MRDLCVLCGDNLREVVYHFDETDVVRCAGCGLVYASRVPPPDELRKRYARGYFEEFYGDGTDRSDAGEAVMRRLESLAPGRGRLLDVGCGAGDYLASARAAGWEAVGIDISSHAIETARARGHNVIEGALETACLERDSFDAAICIHSLEHQIDPVAHLRDILRVLKQGGVLFVSTPNFAGAVSRRERERWKGLRIGQHFFFFTRDTLRRVVEAAGFVVLEVEAPAVILSGETVDRFLGRGAGGAARRAARLMFGSVIDKVRRAAAAHAEGDSVILTAKKP